MDPPNEGRRSGQGSRASAERGQDFKETMMARVLEYVLCSFALH